MIAINKLNVKSETVYAEPQLINSSIILLPYLMEDMKKQLLENVKKKTKYINLKHFVKMFDYLQEHIHRFKIFEIIKHTTKEQAICRPLNNCYFYL